MAVKPQSYRTNIPPYPRAWYEASGSWAANTGADRVSALSPDVIQLDIGASRICWMAQSRQT